jgi:hypothetical protein
LGGGGTMATGGGEEVWICGSSDKTPGKFSTDRAREDKEKEIGWEKMVDPNGSSMF